MRTLLATLGLIVAFAAPAIAWNHRGHEITGIIADQRLTPSARKAVADILGAIDLPTATKWADCVKSVRPPNFEYRPLAQYAPPCTTFANSAQEKSRMQDYVRRNWNTCGLGSGCHNTYHYTDVAIQRGMYGPFIGTNDHDIVHAINACLAVLRGKPAPAPFHFEADDSERKKEALLLLSHLVGDVHQPLHVGAVYLSARGALVDPDGVGKLDPETDTEGGNKIVLDGKNLHIQWWDDAPNAWDLNMVKMLVRDVPEFPMQADELDGIVEYWASESVERAAGMFAGLTFQPKTRVGSKEVWPAITADLTEYAKGVDFTSQISVRLAGSRLAAMLNAIWP